MVSLMFFSEAFAPVVLPLKLENLSKTHSLKAEVFLSKPTLLPKHLPSVP